MIPLIEDKSCTGCGNCLEVCPPGAISLQNEVAFITEDLCEECGFCASACPVGAIDIPFPVSGEKEGA